ncbi:MAG: carboxymuconolactone decarboxylase family protein, partial [Pseudonocardia sp.]
MPRVPGVPTRSAGLLGRLAYRYARRRFGAVPEPLTVLMHHRAAATANIVAELAAERALRHLPASLRDLVTYRVATTVGCSWCVDFGTMLMRHAGLDLERLRELDAYPTSPLFTGPERRALAYADAATAQPMTVTDEMVARLDAELGHRGLVELTSVIALENHRARFNHALGITDQGFTSGDACRIPVPADAVADAVADA